MPKLGILKFWFSLEMGNYLQGDCPKMCFLYLSVVLLTPSLHCDTVDADHVSKGAGEKCMEESYSCPPVLLSPQQASAQS